MVLTSNVNADVKLIDSIENLNVMKILVKNFGDAAMNAGIEAAKKDTIDLSGVKLTSTQLFKFIIKLIEENDRLKLK